MLKFEEFLQQWLVDADTPPDEETIEAMRDAFIASREGLMLPQTRDVCYCDEIYSVNDVCVNCGFIKNSLSHLEIRENWIFKDGKYYLEMHLPDGREVRDDGGVLRIV